MSSRQLRVVLYSHDTMGMGHMRRNFLLARSLAAAPIDASVLLVAGAREVNAFAVPPGADCLTLPALHKAPDGRYHPRSLALPLQQLVALRAAAIRGAVEAFNPDLMIVDKVPRGALHELDPTLEYLRSRGGARCVLGLRDVLDEPDVVHREWAADASSWAIREFFDAVWIYGDPTVYDLLREYQMPEPVAERARFTGYLDPRARAADSDDDAELLRACGIDDSPFVLCQVGGGQDGIAVAEAFAGAELSAGALGVLLTGPFMPAYARQRLKERAAATRHLRVVEFLSEPTQLLRRADRVVSMGGYNTVCEVLSHGKRALIVPRTSPRREQLIRAERLRDLNTVDLLRPDELGSERLNAWLRREPTPRREPVFEQIDFNGLARLPHLVDELVSSARPNAHN
jgi:predicted glycosyltransferase